MEEKHYKIKANVFSIDEGNKSYKNVKAIRIVSDKYNILIMEDYLPVIGEIDGSVNIVLNDHTEEFKNIKGFFKHSHNQFDLLIKEINNA